MHLGNIEIALREFFIRQGEDTAEWQFKIERITEFETHLDVVFWAMGPGWKTYEVLVVEEEDGLYFARL
jgi:hypothetical protein